eukprot:c23673_g1_i2 orf=1129-1629(+)
MAITKTHLQSQSKNLFTGIKNNQTTPNANKKTGTLLATKSYLIHSHRKPHSQARDEEEKRSQTAKRPTEISINFRAALRAWKRRNRRNPHQLLPPISMPKGEINLSGLLLWANQKGENFSHSRVRPIANGRMKGRRVRRRGKGGAEREVGYGERSRKRARCSSKRR